jgi:hypothetical protein
MPNVATLLKESVLVLILKVVGLACANELSPSLAREIAVTVLANEITLLLLGGEGVADVGGVGGGMLEAVTVVTVIAGDGGVSEEVIETVTTVTASGNAELELSIAGTVLEIDAVGAVSVVDANAVTVAVCICVSTTVMVVNETASEELCDCPASALLVSSKAP